MRKVPSALKCLMHQNDHGSLRSAGLFNGFLMYRRLRSLKRFGTEIHFTMTGANTYLTRIFCLLMPEFFH